MFRELIKEAFMENLTEIEAINFELNFNSLRKAYYEDGGFIIRNLLPISLINEVATQIIKLIELIDSNLVANCPFSVTTDTVKSASWLLQEVERLNPGNQSIIYDTLSHTLLMHKIASEDKLLNILHHILSPNILLHPRLIVLMNIPYSTWHLAGWHQDFYYNEGPYSTCTVYAPLQHTNGENGGLILAKKELKLGALPHSQHDNEYQTKWNTLSPNIVSKFKDLVEIEMNAGDVLFFHSLCPHTAQINKSDHVRFVINFRYRDLMDQKYREDNWRIQEIHEARSALQRKNS